MLVVLTLGRVRGKRTGSLGEGSLIAYSSPDWTRSATRYHLIGRVRTLGGI